MRKYPEISCLFRYGVQDKYSFNYTGEGAGERKHVLMNNTHPSVDKIGFNRTTCFNLLSKLLSRVRNRCDLNITK